MFKFIVAVALFGLVAANHLDKNAQVRSFQNDVQGDGSYHYSYDISNGISGQQSGNGDRATGHSSHISPEGQTIQLRYTADEFGFHPEGDHLPTPPPIPDYILRSLEYIRTHQAPEGRSLSSSSFSSPRKPQQPSRQAFLAPFLG
ncbi:hypothetical protein ACFFRR_010603 [Megaselia abdita]